MSKKESLVSSDFNLKKITTSELSKHVEASIKMESNMFILGRRGTGKTEIAKQKIAESGLIEVYMNLSVMERVDLGGYPNILGSDKKEFVDFLLPKFYEPLIYGDRKAVLLLDEVDKADPSLWAPLLEITQYRSINGKKFKNLVATISTGNLVSEGGNKPCAPLLDRTEKYLVEADATSWLKWAGVSKIHPTVTAYINDHHDHLFGEIDPGDRYADASPRGWSNASNLIYKGEFLKTPSNIIIEKISGCVGKKIGINYQAYFEYYQDLLPIVNDLFKGENIFGKFNSLNHTKQTVFAMIVADRFASACDTLTPESQEFQSYVRTFVNFFKEVTPELTLIVVRSQLGMERVNKMRLLLNDVFRELITSIHKFGEENDI